jgi:hypothetical protein
MYTTGPAEDIEMFDYIRNEYPTLPDPPGDIPFYEQAFPLPDPYQRHTSSEQVIQATTYQDFNPLPFTRFVGTSTEQINQPQFLSVNEIIFE